MNIKRNLSVAAETLVAILSVAALVVACGGGGGSSAGGTPAANTLAGVAAVGTPIVGGTVNIVCAAGSAVAPTTTTGTGSWQVGLSGQTLPCAIELSGGTISGVSNTTSYHAIAIVSGTVNLTPLTDLVVANLVGTATPSAWFAGLSSSPATLAAITQTKMNAALTNLNTLLSGLTPLSTNNPITTSFTPSAGNVSDNMLTALATAMTNAGVSYASLLNSASTNSPPVFGFNTALTTAYAGTGSGGGTISTIPIGIQMGGARQGTNLNLAGNVSCLVGLESTPCLGPSLNGGWGAFTTDGTYLYVLIGYNAIEKLTIATGSGVILAGTVGNSGYLDGPGATAKFNGLEDITTDGTNLYVIDSCLNSAGQYGCVRKIEIATSQVSTIAGASWVLNGNQPTNSMIDGPGSTATFGVLGGITTDGINLYLTDSHSIRQINIASGQVTTLAGPNKACILANTCLFKAGSSPVLADGVGTGAYFVNPLNITTDGTNLYLTDIQTIRKVAIATQTVSTLAGQAYSFGRVDGTGSAARFDSPSSITTDGSNLYVVDQPSINIRQINISTRQTSTLEGKSATFCASNPTDSGCNGNGAGTNLVNGPSSVATFYMLHSITTDGKSLYFGDYADIRMVK